MTIKVIEGQTVAPAGARFVIVAARFNELIVDRLVEGATNELKRRGVPEDAIVLVRTPGAFEIPVAAQRLAASGKVDAVLALGAVIRGSTPHFDYVCGEAASGCGRASSATGVPVIFGVLTTDTIEQAIERAGTKAGNKGADAAAAAIEMVSLGRALTQHGY
jgi:6,7-dimethyl-8-ribityllumazine synthase